MRLLITCLTLLITINASAAPRTCRVLFLGAPTHAPRELQLFDGTTSRPIELPRMNFSPVYELASGDIVLRLLEKAPEKPEDIPASAPSLALRDSVTDFYLLISTDPAGETLLMQSIDANTDGFREGSLLWFNLTPNRVGGKLGTETLALEPDSKKISPAPADGRKDYPVDIYYQMPGEEEVWPLCETKWRHNPDARIVMFVLPEAGTRTPRIMSFTDFRQEKENQ